MNETDPWLEFLKWEGASRDTIDFKTIYVDMADDLVTGLLLSQIVYWYLPSKKGQSKLRIFKDGYYWIAKARHEWWDEIRIKPRQIDRAIAILEERGIIVTHLYRFNNAPTTHIRIDKDGFLASWNSALARFDEMVKSEIPPDPFSPNLQFDLTDSLNPNDETVKSDLPESVQSITETTIDSPETTAEIIGDFPENPSTDQMREEQTDAIQVQSAAQNRIPEKETFEAGDPQRPAETVLWGEGRGHPELSPSDSGRDHAPAGKVADPLTLDLARRTEAARAPSGNYATPPCAGGDDDLAAFGLFCLYDKRGKQPPKQGTKEHGQQCERVREALRAYGYQQADLQIVEKAAEIHCERKGQWVNVFYKSFVADFGVALQDGEYFIKHGYLPANGNRQQAPRRDPGRFDEATRMTLERLENHGDR